MRLLLSQRESEGGMHEYGLCEGILEAVQQRAWDQSVARVRAGVLRVRGLGGYP
jgi:hypothetical protein